MRKYPRVIESALKANGIALPKKPSKYGSTRTVIYGLRFDSKAEAEYYKALRLQKSLIVLRQVSFDLPGSVRYRADFMTIAGTGVHYSIVRFFDIKGVDTPVSKLKRKQVEEIYGVHIEVLRAQYVRGKIVGFEEVAK